MDNRELWYQQLHIEDRERVIQEETFSRTSGEALRSEYRLLAKDGSEIWFRDEAAVIRDTSGQPLFLQGVMYDITDRKKIEAKLIQSERKEDGKEDEKAAGEGIPGVDCVAKSA